MRAAGAPSPRRLLPGLGHPHSGSCPARAPGSTSTSGSAAPGMHRHRHRRRRDPAPVLPGLPRAVRHPRLGAGPRARPARARERIADGGAGAADRAGLPGRRDHADPRRRADGAADPRVGRARHRAGPDPRLGGRVRRDLLAGPRPARLAAVRLRADEHHRSTRRSRARSARSGTTTRARPAAPRDIVRDGIWVGVLAGRDSAAVAGLDYARHGPRGRLGPAADGADDQRRPAAGPAHAGGDDRRDRRRHPHGAPTGPGRSTTGG